MSLNLRPLLSALRRSPTGAILLTMQVAITLAVLVNAAWLVSQRIEQLEQPTGFDTRDTFAIDISGLSNRFDIAQAESEDLAYLRGLPGVAAATVATGIPLTGNGQMNDSLWLEPGEHGTSVVTNVMTGDEQALRTLGVPLAAGRNFRPDEVRPFSARNHARPPAEIIVTEAFAHALFPQGNALGRTVYDRQNDPLTIIGITRNFMGTVTDSGFPIYNTILAPVMSGQYGFYALLVRAQPGRRGAVMRAAERHIGMSHRYGVINLTLTLAEAKDGFEAGNRNVAIFLATVTALMLAVCCLGIFGLTTFNVGSRTRQIGTRRAVGACRRDIVAHFMAESGLILTAGVLLGSVLALAIGAWLTAHYGLPRLDLGYLLAGAAVLWVVGQLAAWHPAHRAASVPPSVATRTI